MAPPRLSEETIIASLIALRAANGSQSEAARNLGIERTTLQHHLQCARERNIELPPEHKPSELHLPDFPVDDLPIEEIIDIQCERFTKRKVSHDAHTWFPVKVFYDGPIGLLWWGDPHLDDNGCNWPLIKRYAELCRTNDGVYSVNIGDSTNNWAGRLVRLYADQDTSLKTARRLAKWFMHDSDITWLLWLLGNHDDFGDGAAILAMMSRDGSKPIVVHDWEARFRLVFPNGREVKIHAAHNFKGHSLWHNMHGLIRQANLGEDADLLVAGHLHTWGVHKEELANRGGTYPTMIRVRGFKRMDDFARKRGFSDEEEGGAIMTVIDPHAESRSGVVNVFTDVEQGIKVLNALRQ